MRIKGIGLGALLIVLGTALPGAAKDIGVVWAGKSGMAVRVAKGFDKGMKELAPDVKIEYQRELGSIEEVAQVVARYQQEKDAMLVLRSNGAKWLGTHPPTIPAFIGGCNNPVELGVIRNMQAPEGKVTGVTYYLPVETQFDVFTAILPNLKSVLLLVEAGHPSAAIDVEETRAACAKRGIAYREARCSTPEDVTRAVAEQGGQVSAIISGNQALLIDHAKAVVAAAGKTPVLSYSEKPVKDGALGGFVADDEKLGYLLAESVVKVVVQGKAIREVPVKMDPKPVFYVNARAAEALGVEIPYEILQSATIVE